MRFGASIMAVMAFAASALAQAPTKDFDPIDHPLKNEVIPAGSTYTVSWQVPDQYKDDTVKISLIGGKTQLTQIPVADIATGVKNSAGSYEWAVDATLGTDNVYGLVFKLESDPTIFQYSNPFHIKGSYSSGGTKTVTLSSKPCTTSTTSTTSVYTPTPVAHTTTCTTTPSVVITTPYVTPINPPPTTIVTSASAPVTIPNSAGPTSVPTQPASGASHAAAAPLAIIGAIAMAMFTL